MLLAIHFPEFIFTYSYIFLLYIPGYIQNANINNLGKKSPILMHQTCSSSNSTQNNMSNIELLKHNLTGQCASATTTTNECADDYLQTCLDHYVGANSSLISLVRRQNDQLQTLRRNIQTVISLFISGNCNNTNNGTNFNSIAVITQALTDQLPYLQTLSGQAVDKWMQEMIRRHSNQ